MGMVRREFTRILYWSNFCLFSFRFYCRAEKAASCLLPNTCLGIATYIIARFESNEVGLTWDKVSASPTPEDDFSFSMVLGMFVVQSIIYGIIAWYVILYTLRYSSTWSYGHPKGSLQIQLCLLIPGHLGLFTGERRLHPNDRNSIVVT